MLSFFAFLNNVDYLERVINCKFVPRFFTKNKITIILNIIYEISVF